MISLGRSSGNALDIFAHFRVLLGLVEYYDYCHTALRP